MDTSTKRIELLAPAKDVECGIAAIDCGADAVYIGATRFGARENAGNSVEDIATLVQHAHQYWAKVYVTLNTLLYDKELPLAEKLIAQLYAIGIDGLIIQDTGLLECNLPPIPLIASTQMHNHTPEKVAFLEKVGFQRVILARELNLTQIKEIRQHTSVELECFIHGALCVGYSGQCYLSCAHGGRSGNRGQCAQPCRRAYSLEDGQGNTLVHDKHLLSLRDLNLTAQLGDLIDAGVTSFKIEGRLKDKAYVTNIVSHYRQKLDAVLSERGLRKSSSGDSAIDFTPNPLKTFNRGFTSYNLHGGRDEAITAHDTPKMVGEYVGRVAAVTRYSFTLDGLNPLHNGDGICFFAPDGELQGASINNVQGPAIVPTKLDGIVRGMEIYRNHDHEFLTNLTKARTERQIAVSFTLQEMRDGMSLTAVDEDGNAATFALACEKATAEKPESALANIEKQLSKTGGTLFRSAGITIDFATPIFLPVSTLNALRRGVLEELTAIRAKRRPVQAPRFVKNTEPYPESIINFRGNVLNCNAVTFYRRHGVAKIQPAAEAGTPLRGRVVMTTKYCIRHEFGW